MLQVAAFHMRMRGLKLVATSLSDTPFRRIPYADARVGIRWKNSSRSSFPTIPYADAGVETV